MDRMFSRTDAARRRLLRGGAIAIVAAMLALAVSACGGGGASVTNAHATVNGHVVKGLFGSLPTSGPATGTGTISMGQLSGDTPTYLFPYTPGSFATDGTAFLIDQLYVPLYNLQVGGTMEVNYATSLADRPTFSNHDRTATIRLRPNAVWSDGTRVDAQDVLFSIALLKAAVKANPSDWDQYTPGLLPDNIASATAAGPDTVQITFKRSYNPAYLTADQLAYTIIPLPSRQWNVETSGGAHVSQWQDPAVAAKIYAYLNKAGSTLSTFASNPLWQTVDGPFRLHSFNTTNSSFTLAANPRYSLTGKVRFSTLAVNTFTSTTALLNGLKSGSVEVGTLDFSQLGAMSSLRREHDSVFGYPNIGSFGFILNFKDPTDDFDKIIGQLYVRQALAHLIDQNAYIKGIFKGAAAPAYGPLPTIPRTPYTPADAGSDPYPYSVSAAASLLRAHGWKVVPGGQTVCRRAGTSASECGAGIPAGTPLKIQAWSVPAEETQSIALESDALASAARQVGIKFNLGTKTFNFQIENFNNTNPAAAPYTKQWAVANWGEYGTTPYPTEQSNFSTHGSGNMGAYSSPVADRLINQALYGTQASAATRVADYLARNLPILPLPCADVIDAVSPKIGGTADSFLAMTQDIFYPQYWYLKKAAGSGSGGSSGSSGSSGLGA